MGMEEAMMTDSDGKVINDFFEMPNGCICCAAKDDLVTTLDNVLVNVKGGLDYILLETNGLADPATLIQTFWMDDELDTRIEFHSCLVVIDAARFGANLENEELKDLLVN